jgi:MoxR-like ATPase
MLRRWGSATRSPVVEAASNGPELLALREAVDEVFVAPEIQAYLLALVRHTRSLAAAPNGSPRPLAFGASPRATLALYQASRALAFLRGLEHVTPSLVQEVAPDVLRHRIGLTYEAEAGGLTADTIVSQTLAAVAVPG